MRIPLTSRRAEGLMPFPVTDRSATVAPDPSLRPAGADIPEADAAQRIAADPSVIDAERDPLYRDGVQSHLVGAVSERETEPLKRGEPHHRTADVAEHVRQSRLSRWQEQR